MIRKTLMMPLAALAATGIFLSTAAVDCNNDGFLSDDEIILSLILLSDPTNLGPLSGASQASSDITGWRGIINTPGGNFTVVGPYNQGYQPANGKPGVLFPANSTRVPGNPQGSDPYVIYEIWNPQTSQFEQALRVGLNSNGTLKEHVFLTGMGDDTILYRMYIQNMLWGQPGNGYLFKESFLDVPVYTPMGGPSVSGYPEYMEGSLPNNPMFQSGEHNVHGYGDVMFDNWDGYLFVGAGGMTNPLFEETSTATQEQFMGELKASLNYNIDSYNIENGFESAVFSDGEFCINTLSTACFPPSISLAPGASTWPTMEQRRTGLMAPGQ